MTDWVDARRTGDLDQEDVIRFDHGGRTFANFPSPDDAYFATRRLCAPIKTCTSPTVL